MPTLALESWIYFISFLCVHLHVCVCMCVHVHMCVEGLVILGLNCFSSMP